VLVKVTGDGVAPRRAGVTVALAIRKVEGQVLQKAHFKDGTPNENRKRERGLDSAK
jgi:hypothetical protein